MNALYIVKQTSKFCVIDPAWKKMRQIFTVVDSGITTSVWAINRKQQIFVFYKGQWRNVGGRLKHVSSGRAGVWGTSNNNNIYYRQGASNRNRRGRRWIRVSGRLRQIDSGPRGIVCGVTTSQTIYCRTQITHSALTGRGWTRVSGRLKYISCGDYGYWGVSRQNNIYFREGVSRSNLRGSRWKKIPGKLTQIEAGRFGQVWGVNRPGRVYVRQGVSEKVPWGRRWKLVRTKKKWKHITIGIGAVLGIGKSGYVYRTMPTTGGRNRDLLQNVKAFAVL